MNITVIMPTFNEAGNIQDLIVDAKSSICSEKDLTLKIYQWLKLSKKITDIYCAIVMRK